MVVRVIQQGPRGLVIMNDNKLLFPDRSWKDAREGFACDIEVVHDKGTYAFVRGRMLETATIGIENVDIDPDVMQTLSHGELNGQEFLIQWNDKVRMNNGYRVLVCSKNADGISRESCVLPMRPMSVIDHLRKNAKSLEVMDVIIDSAPQLNFESDYQYFYEMAKFLQKRYSESSPIGSNVAEVDYRVYNSSLIIERTYLTYSHSNIDCVFRYQGELGKGEFVQVKNFFSAKAAELFDKGEPLDMQELEEMALDFKVCCGIKRYGYDTFDKRLVAHTFEALGSGVVVYAFNLEGYDLSWLETEEARPYVDLVDDSFERLGFLKKRLGKITRDPEILSKMSDRKWLFPFRVQ